MEDKRVFAYEFYCQVSDQAGGDYTERGLVGSSQKSTTGYLYLRCASLSILNSANSRS